MCAIEISTAQTLATPVDLNQYRLIASSIHVRMPLNAYSLHRTHKSQLEAVPADAPSSAMMPASGTNAALAKIHPAYIVP